MRPKTSSSVRVPLLPPARRCHAALVLTAAGSALAPIARPPAARGAAARGAAARGAAARGAASRGAASRGAARTAARPAARTAARPAARTALRADVPPATGGATVLLPPSASGGAALGGLAPTRTHAPKAPAPPSRHAPGRWLAGTTVTEYWPAPEAWFSGAMVNAPGLAGPHRIDWLYSASGVSMEGEGLGLDGRRYHIDALGDGGWVTLGGRATSPFDGWAAGSPFWRAGGYWRNRAGAVTYPLAAGGWSAGPGRRYVPLPGVSFAPGPSLPLRFLRSLAVDPRVIPLGSLVYIPAYRSDGFGGWFVAQDTGGAIRGRHVDVYRSPPARPPARPAAQPPAQPAGPADSGRYLSGQRIYVIKPGSAK